MAEFFSVFIELELAGEGNGWTELEDVLQPVPISLKYGIDGHTPRDRVAGAGTLSFALDNSADNSAGLLGYYSPGHVNVRAGFGLGIGVRVRLQYADMGAYFKWRGVIDSVKPLPGIEKERRVFVTCIDWMDEALRATLRGVPVQLHQRSDQLFQTIVANIVKQPAALQVGFGMEQYAFALDQARDYGVSVLTEFQKLANSELGFIYVKGDAIQGGTLVFEDRRERGTITASVATFTSVNELAADRQRGDVINRVQVKTHPRRVDDVSPTFDPSDIAGMTLWLAADEITGLNDGDPVSSWLDQSGVGNHYSNPSGTDRPTYKTGILNGSPVVRFDGINDLLSGPDIDVLITAAAATIFVVAKKNTAVGIGVMLADSVPRVSFFYSGTTLNAFNHNGTADTAIKSPATPTEWKTLMWQHAGSVVYVSSGDARDSGRVGVASGNTLAGGLTQLGANGVSAQLFAGDIAEVIVYGVALTESERQNVESYLAFKYDLTLPYGLTGTGTPGTAIFNLEEAPFIAQNTEYSILCPYKDPNQRKARIGAVAQVDPVAITDYLFNSAQDGTGTDLTSQLTITAVFGGNTADVIVRNDGPIDGFLTFFQLRGLGIYDDAEVVLEAEDVASQAAVGEHVLNFDMPYQSDADVARNAAFYLLEQNKTQFTVPTRIGFLASGSDAFMRQAILREPSDRITIIDPMTGIDGDFFINGIQLSVDEEGMLRCSWAVVPGDSSLYWILDSLTQSQLDETTKLAYGLWNRFWLLGIAAMGEDTRLNP